MSLLNSLGNKYRTDKSSDGKRHGEAGRGHNYLTVYEKYIEQDRLKTSSVLEIGVQKGASLRMWQDYFPNAKIYGLDIAESALNVKGERIAVHLVDQSDAASLQAFAEEFGPFDLIIEDGSHKWDHQIITLQTLLHHVKPGGKYILEDLHTSYSNDFSNGSKTTGVQYLLKCCERVVADRSGFRISEDEDNFLYHLNRRLESILVLRSAAMFFCR